VILIATVHLGWHYAIDGYVGILGTLLIWRLTGRLLGWPPLVRWLWGRSGPSDADQRSAQAGAQTDAATAPVSTPMAAQRAK
jgi:hypothetical protein